MIELGGNIKLRGFKELDQPTLIIVKKIVGNYVKQIGEQNITFSELLLELERGDRFGLKAVLQAEKDAVHAEVSDENLFFALDKALDAVLVKTRKKE